MKTNQEKDKNSAIIFSILIGLIVIIQITFFTGRNSAAQTLYIGDFPKYDLITTEQHFIQSPTNDNLLLLLKVLCYESEVKENEQSHALIKQYGTELFLRAKRNEIDLAKVDKEVIMLEVIRVIKKYGAS